MDHQLAWAPRGVLTAVTEQASFILPPTRALWIPAGIRHEITSAGNASMRALYIRPELSGLGWKKPAAVAITPLIAELISYLNDDSVKGSPRTTAERLLMHLLAPVPMTTVDVRLPSGTPARKVAEALIARPAEAATLAEWGRRVGASHRTLARSFLTETGLSFGRWRTLVRVQAALGLLAAGRSVAAVAYEVGYETDSAFVAAFRRATGVTPANYFQRNSDRPAKSSSRRSAQPIHRPISSRAPASPEVLKRHL